MMTRHPGVRAAMVAALVTTAVGTAACSGGNEVADLTTVAPPASIDTAPDTTGAGGDTTVAATEPAATDPDGTDSDGTDSDGTDPAPTSVAPGAPPGTVAGSGPTFSDALGVRVDTAPGVRTRGDTRRLLDAGLYVHIAWEADPDDPSVFTVQPDDVEILEAYANAVTVYYRAATTTRATDDPEFAQYFTDAGAKFEESFQQALDGGFVLSLGTGVVLRPYIPADQRTSTTAIVLDCYLQNQQYFVPSDGVPPAGELDSSPTIASMVLVEGRWMIDRSATEPAACL